MGEYNAEQHGRRTVTRTPSLLPIVGSWRRAAELNKTNSLPGEWVPSDSVFVRDDISPREAANVDEHLVREYAEVLDQLPPITVQRRTFVMVDGMHRLQGSYLAEPAGFVRIVEVDVVDEELRRKAFQANARHGRPITTRDRTRHLSYLLETFGNSLTDKELVAECGVSLNTVGTYRRRLLGPRQIHHHSESTQIGDFHERALQVQEAALAVNHDTYVRIVGWRSDSTWAAVADSGEFALRLAMLEFLVVLTETYTPQQVVEIARSEGWLDQLTEHAPRALAVLRQLAAKVA